MKPSESSSQHTNAGQCPPRSDLPAPTLRVLLVDDDAQLRGFLQILFEQLGHDVIAVSSGAKALNLLGGLNGKIDVVLLDYLMPGMDGEETLNRMRQLQPGIKVILMSGAEELRLRRVFSTHQIDGHLHKPLLSDDIFRVVGRVTAQPVIASN